MGRTISSLGSGSFVSTVVFAASRTITAHLSIYQHLAQVLLFLQWSLLAQGLSQLVYQFVNTWLRFFCFYNGLYWLKDYRSSFINLSTPGSGSFVSTVVFTGSRTIAARLSICQHLAQVL